MEVEKKRKCEFVRGRVEGTEEEEEDRQREVLNRGRGWPELPSEVV